jgi:hypothetical protein
MQSRHPEPGNGRTDTCDQYADPEHRRVAWRSWSNGPCPMIPSPTVPVSAGRSRSELVMTQRRRTRRGRPAFGADRVPRPLPPAQRSEGPPAAIPLALTSPISIVIRHLSPRVGGGKIAGSVRVTSAAGRHDGPESDDGQAAMPSRDLARDRRTAGQVAGGSSSYAPSKIAISMSIRARASRSPSIPNRSRIAVTCSPSEGSTSSGTVMSQPFPFGPTGNHPAYRCQEPQPRALSGTMIGGLVGCLRDVRARAGVGHLTGSR